ncbi:MAG: hypothetical protein FWH04_06735 [Oscillospiraceae bacterium]|nr:hypothetical protein [Oscillospiraceae bacterium]
MGMTDGQFASFRRSEMEEYEDLYKMIEKKQEKEALEKLQKMINRAKKDTEK